MPFTDHDPQTVGALLTAVSGATADLIFVKNCAGELLFANPAALHQLGLSAEEALHRSSNTLYTDTEDAQRVDRGDQRAMRERASLTQEQTLRFGGEMRTYSTTHSPWLDHDGRLMGVVCISTDITARRQAEDFLHAREQQLEATIAERTATLRELANHIETVREEEKHAIARELHDDMGATLTSLSMHLQGAYVLFPDEEKWRLRKAKIQSLLSEVVATTRRMQTSLRPTMLDLFGLKTADRNSRLSGGCGRIRLRPACRPEGGTPRSEQTQMIDPILRDAEQKMAKSVEHFAAELTTIRTGRANPALIDKVMVPYYGTLTPLNQLAQISAPEARLLVVQVYDKSQMGAVEKALRSGDAGLNPSNDGNVIRVPIPPLTEERRREYVKLVKSKAEEARVAIRNVRRDELHRLDQLKGEVAEDETKRASQKLQKITEGQIERVDGLAARKESDVMEL